MTHTENTQPTQNQKHYILPLLNTVIFPKSRTKILVDTDSGNILMKEKTRPDNQYPVGVLIHGSEEPSEISEKHLCKTGCILDISFIQKTEEGYLVGVKALTRVHLHTITQVDDRLYAGCTPVPDIEDVDSQTHQEMLLEVRKTIHEISSNFPGSGNFTGPIDKLESVDEIMGFVMPFIPISSETKQELLETDSLSKRYLMFLEILLEFRENINLQIELRKKVSEKSAKLNRETLLREQLRAIQEELGEIDGQGSGTGGYRDRISESKMPEEVKKKAFEEIKKLETCGAQSHESPGIRNYLDLLLDLPWTNGEILSIDLEKTRHILDCNHYGLDKVKDRIVEHLAVLKLKQEKQGSILLLAGPPGTGKTSLGKSIAEALGRKYIRVSLGGVKDEAEIRGHRRTYVGALPGRIIQGLRRAGTKNPVFVLDEIDKLSSSYSGDPASALLEVLDPEQNSSFSDHYLEVPYSLSDVFFIATANSLASIPPPLLDRMELIEISSYTKQEMFFIGKNHLLPKSLKEHGLDENTTSIEDEALHRIIEKYTHEAGVRGLKKQLDRISRHVSEKIVSGKWTMPCVITSGMLLDILGREVHRHEIAKKNLTPGVATGLAWTPVGGDILFIEGTFMPGTGKLTLTGQLGDVMKESANISMSLIRSRFAHTAYNFDFMASDVHIHVPSGATPKDGPSAGITLFTALVSLFTGRSVDSKLAMTGEVTLSGSVLPVGGIKEKVLAAHRAGITKIILPKENEADLEEIPKEVRNEMIFIPVETIDEVLKETLDITLPFPVLTGTGNHQLPTSYV
ncbi:endopeptidase La [Methanospirillum stamsii]|uniref:Lon protease n=1 Tax=Methanospirillum stamsii TaxID=1277351 RepID=A0A2V2ND51_9EURY|nr:endopeptidase La [Methanospirillum stamsii]PWR75536.1 endopeptidase La [Methanospirillum stamsii]